MLDIDWYSLRRNWKLISILFFALLSGLAVIAYTDLGAGNFGDAVDYLNAAHAIEQKLPYPREGSLPFFRPPGYPYVIATIWKLTGISGIPILKLFNVFFHVGSTLLVSRIAKLGFNQRISIICALLFSFNPLSLHQLSGISTQPLLATLFLWFVYMMMKLPNIKNNILVALISVACVATRPEYIFVIIPVLVLSIFSQNPKKLHIRRVLTVLVILFLPLTVWGYENKKATGNFILLTDATYYHLWMGATDVVEKNYPMKVPASDTFTADQFASLMNEIKAQKNSSVLPYSTSSIKERSDLWRNAFIERIQTIGLGHYAQLLLFKGLVFWRPFLSPAAYSSKLVMVSFVILLPISIGTIVGIIRFARRERTRMLVRIYCLSLSVLTLIHMAELPDMRFRVPMFIPFALIMSGAVLIEVVEKNAVFRKSRY